jgi:hypothetical protein
MTVMQTLWERVVATGRGRGNITGLSNATPQLAGYRSCSEAMPPMARLHPGPPAHPSVRSP